MEKEVFDYLEEKYRYLNNDIRDLSSNIFTAPHSAIIKGRTYSEKLTQQIANLNGLGYLNHLSQFERIEKLKSVGVFDKEISALFNNVRKLGNIAAHSDVEGELEGALNIHKNIYKITCWFVKKYIDSNFEASLYKSPMPAIGGTATLDYDVIASIIAKTMENIMDKQPSNKIDGIESSNSELASSLDVNERDIDDAYTNLLIENIFNEEPDKKCLVQELSRLKESSKEAVEGLNDFTPFKKYMHIVRTAQEGLEDLIINAEKSDTAQLILVCGSVGDGKSHIISYFNNKMPEIMNEFTLHNDATESLEPTKTSMETLNELLDDFSDEKIEFSKQKFILAINLGTLNNFIDSEFGDSFTKLKAFVHNKKILETTIKDSSFDGNSSFQFVNFSDYHIFTLKDGKVYSKYVMSLIQKVTQSLEIDSVEKNIFYKSYKKNCSSCGNNECCPIKANYELLSKENVQASIIDLLVQCIIKDKIIISTRALLNFLYELIVPRSQIDVNRPTFKNAINKLNIQDYIKSLMPNIIFDHKELSFIFESLSRKDPLNVRNEKLDSFIIDFNNSTNLSDYFKEYIDYPIGYLDRINDIDFKNTQDKRLKYELLRLFIRSYYLCGRGNIFSLKDEVYDEYINAIFYWNRGDKLKLKNVYNNVKDGIMKWNGDADKDHMNIFMGKNQVKYSISEKVELKFDTSNLPKSDEIDLKKFIDTIRLRYKGENSKNSYEIEIDYNLYQLLVQVNKGYRPNKKDKNNYIKFIEFINKLEETGSQNEAIVITEKNRENNNKFKLEYDEEFETYRFVEI